MFTLSSLSDMVKHALQEYDSEEYKRLQQSGELEQWAKMRAESAWEAREYLREKAMDEAATSQKESLDRVKEHFAKNRQADEAAISQATDFLIRSTPNEMTILD